MKKVNREERRNGYSASVPLFLPVVLSALPGSPCRPQVTSQGRRIMVRKSCMVLGLCLGLVWWFGLSRSPATTILWFNAIAAVMAFGISGLIPDGPERPSYAWAPAILGLALGAVWLGGMAAHQAGWAVWANFVFAVAFLGVAIAATAAQRGVLASARHNR
jgi:hypothetical protein